MQGQGQRWGAVQEEGSPVWGLGPWGRCVLLSTSRWRGHVLSPAHDAHVCGAGLSCDLHTSLYVGPELPKELLCECPLRVSEPRITTL